MYENAQLVHWVRIKSFKENLKMFNHIRMLYKDRAGGLWIRTYSAGLNEGIVRTLFTTLC